MHWDWRKVTFQRSLFQNPDSIWGHDCLDSGFLIGIHEIWTGARQSRPCSLKTKMLFARRSTRKCRKGRLRQDPCGRPLGRGMVTVDRNRIAPSPGPRSETQRRGDDGVIRGASVISADDVSARASRAAPRRFRRKPGG